MPLSNLKRGQWVGPGGLPRIRGMVPNAPSPSSPRPPIPSWAKYPSTCSSPTGVATGVATGVRALVSPRGVLPRSLDSDHADEVITLLDLPRELLIQVVSQALHHGGAYDPVTGTHLARACWLLHSVSSNQSHHGVHSASRAKVRLTIAQDCLIRITFVPSAWSPGPQAWSPGLDPRPLPQRRRDLFYVTHSTAVLGFVVVCGLSCDTSAWCTCGRFSTTHQSGSYWIYPASENGFTSTSLALAQHGVLCTLGVLFYVLTWMLGHRGVGALQGKVPGDCDMLSQYCSLCCRNAFPPPCMQLYAQAAHQSVAAVAHSSSARELG